ncbi:hypothetical protein GGR55DRAFT_695387 [Xylaria sp. FL0064]|nr:hypothetical protein GGR55DRAFT_695387 [Xylaria sp. FL0064]
MSARRRDGGSKATSHFHQVYWADARCDDKNFIIRSQLLQVNESISFFAEKLDHQIRQLQRVSPMHKMAKPTTDPVPNIQSTRVSRIPPPRTPRVDHSSATYKQAASKYTRFMIAMPILLVTSYYLFDRLALGHEPKNLRRDPLLEESNKE